MTCIFGSPIVFLLAHLGVFAISSASSADNISESFVKFAVVPDVIPVAPSALAKVVYPGDVQVLLGNEVHPSRMIIEPCVSWDGDVNSYYTLAMVDPDAPSRSSPLLREFLHWLVGNIPGNDLKTGETLAAYVPPTPPPGTGFHRYVYLIYRQPGRVDFNTNLLDFTTEQLRVHTSINDFANEYNLGVLALSAENVSEAFINFGVVPDAILVAPSDLAKVVYPGDVQVSLGNEVSPSRTIIRPRVDWDGDMNSFYTLVMIEIDLPTRALPLLRAFLHWLVGNIPGSDVTKGETLAAYVPPIPPPATGLHRYVFLIYQQPERIDFNMDLLDFT
ncbi:unnamed protein product, partial [Iphiclides podalirius]